MNKIIDDSFKFLFLFSFWNTQGDNELENVPISEDMDFFSSEKLIDVENVSSQKVQSMRMVMFH